ncbi:hypothetical protein C8Q77DRAFT_1135499 [Trametes polyzona]|nr:hypothetical protein C8Q77DRAFT_1135499 [Trametes polyzona]
MMQMLHHERAQGDRNWWPHPTPLPSQTVGLELVPRQPAPIDAIRDRSPRPRDLHGPTSQRTPPTRLETVLIWPPPPCGLMLRSPGWLLLNVANCPCTRCSLSSGRSGTRAGSIRRLPSCSAARKTATRRAWLREPSPPTVRFL